MAEVTMYGADWCGDCRRSKALLNAVGVEFEMKDVEGTGFATCRVVKGDVACG